MNSRVIVIALVLCIGLMLYFTFFGHGRPTGPMTSKADEGNSIVDDRGEKLIELQRQIDVLQDKVERGANAPKAHSPSIRFHEPSVIELQATRQRAIGRYESAFSGSLANPANDSMMRASALDAALSDKMASLASLPTQPDFDCQGEMCRVSGVFSTPSAADAWATYYLMEMTDLLPASRYFLEPVSGGVKIRLYMFTRSGSRIMAGIDRDPR